MMILVVGATGLLGFEICRRLCGAGHGVRAIVRSPASARARELAALGATSCAGELRDPASLSAACQGVTTVVTTATAASRKGRGETIEAIDRDGQMSLVKAAVDAGVRRFVHVSVAPTRARCPFVRYKREVEEAIRASGMRWVILQPTAFMDVWFSPVMGWDLQRGRARLFGDGRARTSYIAVADVAAFGSLAAVRDDIANRELVLGGPEALSGLDVVALCEELSGKRFKVQRVPIAVLRAVALLVRPFDSKLSSLMTMGATAAAYGDPIDMTAVLRDFPLHLTSVRDHMLAAIRPSHPVAPHARQ